MYALSFKDHRELNARLLFKSTTLRRITPLTPSVIDITPRFAPDRLKIENFIRDIYRKSYDADISVGYPTLMSVRDASGEILAAAGFRIAGDEPLFLEQYTRTPIENVLTELYKKDIGRDDIAEIGNLASAGKGASVFLFAAIASYLLQKGVNYATVTGTDQLHKRFRMMGLNPHTICNADRSLLNAEQKNWGSYYDTQPRVLAGSLEDSMQRLNDKLGAVYQENGVTLFPRLHKKWRVPCV